MEVPEPGMQKNMAWLVGRNCILDCNSSTNCSALAMHSPVLPGVKPLMRPARQGHAIVYRWAWMITRSILALKPGSSTPIVYFFFPLIVSLEHWQKCHTRTTHMATISDYNRNWLPIVTVPKETMDYHPTLALRLDTIVTCIHAMWEHWLEALYC